MAAELHHHGKHDTYTPAHQEQDIRTLAILNGHWQGKIVDVMDTPQQISKLHQQRERIYGFIQQATGVEISSDTTHLTGALDNFFTAVNYHRQTQGSSQFGELAYLGINPSGIESLWGPISELAQTYASYRPPVASKQVERALIKRKATTETVLRDVNRDLKGFYTTHPALVQEAIANAYARMPVAEDISQTKEESEVQSALREKADEKLAQALGCPTEAVPFSYSWFAQQNIDGLLIPQFESMVAFNRATRDGKEIHLNCCPNYATEKTPDGTYVYTFSSLGTGLGLTAERGFPLLMRMVDRVQTMHQKGQAQKPLHIRVAVADFEATESNAEMVGLTVAGFKQHLGKSVEGMVGTFEDFAHHHQMPTRISRTNSADTPIGEWQMQLGEAAKISFGAVSETYRAISGYNGESSFHHLVEDKREHLAYKARTDKDFQRSLDTILRLRLGLMLRWRDGTEPPLVRHLGDMFDQVTASEFRKGISGFDVFSDQPDLGELQQSVNAVIHDRADASQKSEAIKATIVTWLGKGNNRREDKRQEALEFLHVKVARQGAEDAVMSELHAKLGGAQIVADSAVMWDIFGDRRIARLGVKGKYEGADK
ncbi:MAG TPA: hypothetical protein VFQ63_03475 [Patescibacteria group bacterium]|nr:hypothetical protein [Patescibacteria group bacterium]